ncbi:hypothetical protein [Pontibacter pamirensis]|uniref:hypothetical protein n=1 Tax=Pontibacter pamirensis TaxID=2562824 RepID=UPI00138A2622|nr:hypothetical protein [Pontibacter pamirensis]
MKKPIFMLLAAGLFTFASCESTTESRTEEQIDEAGDNIEEGAEEVGEDIEEGAEEVEDEIER